MSIRAVLFDLDDTLIIDEAATRAAWIAAANKAIQFGAEEKTFLSSATRIARELWEKNPHKALCEKIGINDAECIWGSFTDKTHEFIELGKWANKFRKNVFAEALAEQSLTVPEIAIEEVLIAYSEVRRREGRLLPNALDCLAQIKKIGCKVGLLTNGAPSIQNAKIDAVNLRDFFDAIVISGEFMIGKPEAKIFEILLKKLGVEVKEAVMVGNSLARDIAGAQSLGLRSILLLVPGAGEPANVKPDAIAQSLLEIPNILLNWIKSAT
ncbi:MAG: HAD family hydrolase [Chthoniobacterales bacterium]|nr:HAD family hydrolase [Chthoniobacterales bacterium]